MIYFQKEYIDHDLSPILYGIFKIKMNVKVIKGSLIKFRPPLMSSIELSHEYKIVFENEKLASMVSETMMSYLLDLVEADNDNSPIIFV